jgi:hypothetical protein
MCNWTLRRDLPRNCQTLVTPEQISSLQTLVFGGEVLMPKLCDTWANAVTLVNMSGLFVLSTSTNLCMLGVARPRRAPVW